MKKIISLFKRNYETDHLVRDEVVEGAEWVQRGEGVATRKFDGTCCMIKGGEFFKRYELKPGKMEPNGFIAAGEPDPVTGKTVGWVPVGDGPDDKYHREALINEPPDRYGTYELVGPKVQGNPEGLTSHFLVRHGVQIYYCVPTTFKELREWFKDKDIEGIVWHHPDGRMVKIKKKDFGLRRKP